MASPSSLTRAAISSREIRMRPSCRSTGNSLARRGEGGERLLGAEALGDRGRLLARPVHADPDPEARLAVLGAHAGHVGLEPRRRQALARLRGLMAALEGPHLHRPA